MSHVEVVRISLSLKWRFDQSFWELLPRKVFQPGVLFYLVWSAPSQSHHRFTLQKLVYKISCLDWPALRDVNLLNYCLTGQYLLLDLWPGSSRIRSSPYHKFVRNHAQSIVVDCERMILPHHHLRSHVAWCSRSISWILWLHFLRNSEVGYS